MRLCELGSRRLGVFEAARLVENLPPDAVSRRKVQPTDEGATVADATGSMFESTAEFLLVELVNFTRYYIAAHSDDRREPVLVRHPSDSMREAEDAAARARRSDARREHALAVRAGQDEPPPLDDVEV